MVRFPYAIGSRMHTRPLHGQVPEIAALLLLFRRALCFVAPFAISLRIALSTPSPHRPLCVTVPMTGVVLHHSCAHAAPYSVCPNSCAAP